MKKLLLIFLFAMCVIGWRSESIMQMIGLAKPVTLPAIYSIQTQTQTIPGNTKPAGMTLTEYAELAKKDPDAYRKLMASHQQETERSELDKLMNFLTRLKYE